MQNQWDRSALFGVISESSVKRVLNDTSVEALIVYKANIIIVNSSSPLEFENGVPFIELDGGARKGRKKANTN